MAKENRNSPIFLFSSGVQTSAGECEIFLYCKCKQKFCILLPMSVFSHCASLILKLFFIFSGTSTNRYSGVACKKVYFLWICPSHRYFEWFIDVLRDVERKDVTNVLEMHIFITQFFHKFDLRTTMLVSCNPSTMLQKLSKCEVNA